MIFKRSFRRFTHGLQCVKKKVALLSCRLFKSKKPKPKLRKRRRMISMQCVMVKVSFNSSAYIEDTKDIVHITQHEKCNVLCINILKELIHSYISLFRLLKQTSFIRQYSIAERRCDPLIVFFVV